MGSLASHLRDLLDDLPRIEEAIRTLREIAAERLPDDAAPQLTYIVGMARIAVEELSDAERLGNEH